MYKLITIPKSKIRCPYLAIPIPGERPFVVRRDKFEAVTRNINVTDTSLETIKVGKWERVWALKITHRTGRVRGRIVFYSLTNMMESWAYHRFKEEISRWAMSHRKKQSKPASKFDKQITRLRRELDNLYLRKPHNPLISNKWGERNSDGAREAELYWLKQRSDRKMIALIAGRVLKAHITDKTAYKLLREAGYKVTMLSQLKTADCQRLDRSDDPKWEAYWKRVYAFCLPSGYWPNTRERVLYHRKDWELTERLETHAKARLEYVEQKNEADSLKAQIAAIQQLAVVQPVAQPETGLIAA